MKAFRSRYVLAPPIDRVFLLKSIVAVPIGFFYGGAFSGIDMFLIYCVVGYVCLLVAGATIEEFMPESQRQNAKNRWMAYICIVCILFTLTWLVALNQEDPWRHLGISRVWLFRQQLALDGLSDVIKMLMTSRKNVSDQSFIAITG